MTKIFKKSKNNVLGPFWTFFAQIWVKMNFPGKTNALSVFKYSNYLLSCQKSEKTNEPFLKKNELMNR